jgi:hypothetical protein
MERIGRRSSVLSVLLSSLALAPGCTCGRDTSVNTTTATVAAPEGAASAPPSPSAAAASSAVAAAVDAEGALFSAPIAGARAGGADVVAGLLAKSGTVRVMGLSGGQTTWTSDALKDVAWTPDAEILLQPSKSGLALVWHGLHAGKSGRTLVLLGPRGELQGAPIDIGSAFCATDAGVAWLEPRAGGPARVMARTWAQAPAAAVGSIPTDRDPALVCGDHDVMALGDGDDDLTFAAFTPGDPSMHPSVVAVRDADFGDDEEREHDAYTVGDDFGIVRVASSGAVALRQIPRGGAPTSWRRLKHSIPADDDVVAVDGDADATIVVFTHDADEACPGVGSTAEAVRAIRVGRKAGDESLLDLAPADCQRSPGPFWIASTPLGQAIGWVERLSKATTGSAPVVGAAVRLLTAGGSQSRRVEAASDALVDAGCDAQGCSLVALVRPTDGDGMQPEVLRVLAYP